MEPLPPLLPRVGARCSRGWWAGAARTSKAREAHRERSWRVLSGNVTVVLSKGQQNQGACGKVAAAMAGREGLLAPLCPALGKGAWLGLVPSSHYPSSPVIPFPPSPSLFPQRSSALSSQGHRPFWLCCI